MFIGLTYDSRDEYAALGHKIEDIAEFDTEETISAIETTIQSLGHRTERIGHARALCSRLAGGARWDLVFNFAEGLAGRNREAQVPAILEAYGLPYTLSDALVCSVTLDKAVAKRLVASAGLRTPKFKVVRQLSDLAGLSLTYPLFAKPLAEGTGKGIDARSRIDSPEQLAQVCGALLERFEQPVLVEEYLPGREFTTGIVGTGSQARVIGTMEIEILPHAGEAVYSFENKENCDHLVRYSALRTGREKKQVEKLALESYRALECRDAGRVDLRMDGRGRPSFIEVNPLAGMHPTHSDLPMIATQEGMSYAELVGAIIESAVRRIPAVG